MTHPTVLAPGDGETIRPGFEIKVASPELVMTEAVYAPGARGPDPHAHHDHADSFFVLEGQLEWQVGPRLEAHAGPAGSFVSVPPDVLHTFHNPGPGDARFLNLHAPGLGFERYLRGEFPEFDQHYLPEGSGLEPTDVIVLGAGEGERLELGESSATIKVGRDQLAVFEFELGSEFQHPPPHRHPHTLEAFYVLDGQLGLTVDDEESMVPADGCAAVPPGTVHTSPPGAPLRYLNVFAPGGFERFVREAVRLGGPPPPDKFDIEFV
jgi:quercetin dioxygenase-like cupin family protein